MINNLDKIVEALEVINNEALILRDEINDNKEKSNDLENRQKGLYVLKNKVMSELYKNELFHTVGYYKQRINNRKHKLYVNKVKGNDTEIHSLRHYNTDESSYRILGNIRMVKVKDLDTDLSLFDSIDILNKYIYATNHKAKDKTHKLDKSDFNIKETKLVELSRLRVVRDVHIDSYLNPIITKTKKSELIKYMDDNNDKYPKDEAILVRKAKDPKDKRRVIYNIEDGYRRYTLAGELGLDKVYVDIIDE